MPGCVLGMCITGLWAICVAYCVHCRPATPTPRKIKLRKYTQEELEDIAEEALPVLVLCFEEYGWKWQGKSPTEEEIESRLMQMLNQINDSINDKGIPKILEVSTGRICVQLDDLGLYVRLDTAFMASDDE